MKKWRELLLKVKWGMGWGKISCCEKVKSLFGFKDEANTIEAIFLSPLHKAEFIPDIYVWFLQDGTLHLSYLPCNCSSYLHLV